jgi:hypothetical protein
MMDEETTYSYATSNWSWYTPSITKIQTER